MNFFLFIFIMIPFTKKKKEKKHKHTSVYQHFMLCHILCTNFKLINMKSVAYTDIY